jgi:hypothetical protein
MSLTIVVVAVGVHDDCLICGVSGAAAMSRPLDKKIRVQLGCLLQLASCMKALHEANILDYSFSCMSVMYCRDLSYKVARFRRTAPFDLGLPLTEEALQALCTPPEAPGRDLQRLREEGVGGGEMAQEAVAQGDAWSFAALAALSMQGLQPYARKSPDEVRDLIRSGSFPPLDTLPVAAELKAVLKVRAA